MDRKKYDKAEEILKTIARVNRTEDKLSSLSKDSKQTPDEDAAKPTFIDLFRGPRLRKASLALFCVWFVNSLVYFAISLNTAQLGDDDYFTFFLSGLVEIPAGLICIPLMQSPLAKGVLLTVIAMIGKFFVSTSYSMVYLFSAEIFPTIVRSIGVGMCSTMARVGSMAAPILLILGDSWEPLPFLVCGSLSLLVSSLVLTLPETRNKALAATLEDAETFIARKGKPKGNDGDKDRNYDDTVA
ncbi:putative organic cation transporter protein [Apostichopus japonicus]|uniref:Putative organic cation transporter protein n=1 Tax=Stichopus japonicus TaxID=307972 RepID=A0A2G8JUI8_STIJA|nr:putative organic cation transporter protein [Apostichopus japonicus]